MKRTIYEVRYSMFNDGVEARFCHLVYSGGFAKYVAQLKKYGAEGITILPFASGVAS